MFDKLKIIMANEIIQISKDELIRIFEDKLKEVLLQAFIELIPYVSEKEQKEIEEIVGDISKYKKENFEDLYI
ncbi:hypothetical protein YN1_5560 [Nanoarchaeota archaeon]